ncbi:hypothetical protein Y032_0015g2651 [Ancylostoma ceylanicum]|uniref:Uncharacterized protein n=1 Tax=Ancylostoma ceylanicum TaxID=53326 RepID=A0A016V702_9BILA|nr:hypothetical protein Y032_0015g2651 [Ancylostoma ceylanicum]
MRLAKSSVHAQYSPWSRNVDCTRNGFHSTSHLVPPSNRGISPSRRRLFDNRQRCRPSISPTTTPPTIIEHRLEPQSPPRRLPGTFEYGYTYGSSRYRHDQTTFLGTPRLHTRYQPDQINCRLLNRSLHEPRRRQFSPFMPFQRYPEKSSREEKYTNRGPNNSENYRTREFPVNHDWDDSPSLQDPPTPCVYSAGALVIWKEDSYYGFLCDKNTLYGNLHFFADSETVTEEDENKPLGELPPDRLKKGHRVRFMEEKFDYIKIALHLKFQHVMSKVEIEAEIVESDFSDPGTHHLIYVRKILSIGSDACLEAIRPQILVPLTKGRSSPYFRALCETGDLVYIHPSTLLARSLMEFMKQRLTTCHPPYVEIIS